MPRFFQQEQAAAACGEVEMCAASPNGLGKAVASHRAVEGGTAGTAASRIQTNDGPTTESLLMYQLEGISDTAWAAGSWIVRTNVTTANVNLTLEEVHICRASSNCASLATVGSATGLGIVMNAGVHSVNVTGTAQVAGTTDDAYIVLIFNAATGKQLIEVTPNQIIEMPTAAGGQTANPAIAKTTQIATTTTTSQGAVTSTPAVGVSVTAALSPTVVIGALTASPLVAVDTTAAVSPTASNGNTETPTVAVATAAATATTTTIGAVTALPNVAVTTSVAPAVVPVVGALTRAPAVAAATTSATATTATVATVVTPAVAVCTTAGTATTASSAKLIIGGRVIVAASEGRVIVTASEGRIVMAEHHMKTGDLLPLLVVDLVEKDGTIVNLTAVAGGTATLEWRRRGDVTKTTKTITISDAANGQLTYTWQAGDTAVAGEYVFEIIVPFPGGAQTFPAKDEPESVFFINEGL